MINITENIKGVVPVIKIEDISKTVPLGKALCDGGLFCAEITFRANGAEKAIYNMKEAFPKMLVGAGTVLTTEQVDRAAAAGADFIVSPGINPKIVKYCQDKDIAIVPGTITPTEIETALDLGIDIVKFFPAEAAGGLNMIKALAAPYHNVRFMPTGGINEKNLKNYLSFSKVIACGGSFMVTEKLIQEGRFDEITRLTKNAVEIVRSV